MANQTKTFKMPITKINKTEPTKGKTKTKIHKTSQVNTVNTKNMFTKEKFELLQKAYNLSNAHECEIAIIIIDNTNKLYEYADTNIDKTLMRYTEYSKADEKYTNIEINKLLELCNSKEQTSNTPQEQTLYSYQQHPQQLKPMYNLDKLTITRSTQTD